MTRPGDIVEQANATETGRVLACPFIAGGLRDDSAFVVQISAPEGIVLPELVHGLPTSALGRYLGTAQEAKVAETARLVTALVAP